jgi:hypothetical protein
MKLLVVTASNCREYFTYTPQRDRTVCIISQARKIKTHNAFEVLINRNNFARFDWQEWNKAIGTPHGAISISDVAVSLIVFY